MIRMLMWLCWIRARQTFESSRPQKCNVYVTKWYVMQRFASCNTLPQSFAGNYQVHCITSSITCAFWVALERFIVLSGYIWIYYFGTERWKYFAVVSICSYDFFLCTISAMGQYYYSVSDTKYCYAFIGLSIYIYI